MSRFKCPSCGVTLEADETITGKSFTCPKCGKSSEISVPQKRGADLKPIKDADIDRGMTISQYLEDRGMEAEELELDSSTTSSTPSSVISSEHGRRYRIGDLVGEGGMGAILSAKDLNIRRHVAMKVLRQSGKADEKDVLRFISEAQITGQLEHPNIVPVHELGADAAGSVFYTMKLVKGRTLKDILRDIRRSCQDVIAEFPLNRLLNIFLKICDAVAFAHSKGVVHRDLKPENIMVGEYGEVQILDWGLAKVLGKSEDPSNTPALQHSSTPSKELPDWVKQDIESIRDEDASMRTVAGAIMGTPQFMAPEQAYGQTAGVDARTDIYALGGILYKILTLKNAVEGKSVNEVLFKVVNGEISPPQYWNRDGDHKKDHKQAHRLAHLPGMRVPESLAAVAMKALALEANDRYPDVKSMQAEIEAYLGGFATSAEDADLARQIRLMVKRHKREFGLAAVAGVLFMCVIAVAFFRVNQERIQAKKNADRADANALRAENTLNDLEKEETRRQNDRRASAPMFLAAARKAVEFGDLESALLSVNTAIEYDPDLLEGDLLKGQLLLVGRKYKEALGALLEYQEQKPDDRALAELIACCRLGMESETPEIQTRVFEALIKQKQYVFAERVGASREKLFGLYRHRVIEGWKKVGLTSKHVTLKLDDTGKIDLSCKYFFGTDIEFLRGIPLSSTKLVCAYKLQHIRPLRGMPIEMLHLHGRRQSRTSRQTNTHLRSLDGLQETKLRAAEFHDLPNLEDLSALRGLPLQKLTISLLPPYENRRIQSLDGVQGTQLEDLKIWNLHALLSLSALKGLPLKRLSLGAHYPSMNTTLKSLEGIEGSKLEGLYISRHTGLSDISAVKGLPLKSVAINFCYGIKDFTPLSRIDPESLNLLECPNFRDPKLLKDMKSLKVLRIDEPVAQDLTPLKGLSIKSLGIASGNRYGSRRPVRKNLDNLKGLQLEELILRCCNLENIKMARHLPLKKLVIGGYSSKNVRLKSLDGLQDSRLESLYLEYCLELQDISALKGSNLKRVTIWGCPKVTDISVLKGMNLEVLNLVPIPQNIGFLRHVKSIKTINKKSPLQFWPEYDAGKLK